LKTARQLKGGIKIMKNKFLKYKHKLSYDDNYVYSGEHIIGKIDITAGTLEGIGGNHPLAWDTITMKHKKYAAEQLGLKYLRPSIISKDQYGRIITTYVGK
jgi:hypothetical protein